MSEKVELDAEWFCSSCDWSGSGEEIIYLKTPAGGDFRCPECGHDKFQLKLNGLGEILKKKKGEK